MSFFARRVGSQTEAQDLTQQVFVRLMTAKDLGRADHEAAYVFAVAANLLRDRNRRLLSAPAPVTLRDGGLIDELIENSAEDHSPERVLLAKEALADVLRTLDGFGEKTRSIFILFRLENMKQREIAELLGIPQSTVEKHIMKVMFHLSRKYGPNPLW